MVVARAHFVEQRRVHLDAERLVGRLLDLQVEHEPVTDDLEGDGLAVRQGAVLQDVAGLLALDRPELVAHGKASGGGR